MSNHVCNEENFVCGSECTACGSCIQICPKSCIEYKLDSLKVKKAVINSEKCIGCNLCKKSCPECNEIELLSPKKSFAAWSTDNLIRQDSASGGIATEMYHFYAENNGFYAGVLMDEELHVEYRIFNTVEYYTAFQNSKYVHSDTGNIFIKIAESLNDGAAVLMVGLPCQVSGLILFLKAKGVSTDKLMTVDIVCHGTTPPEYLKQHIENIENKKHRKATAVYFRDPEEGTHTFTFSLKDRKGTFYKKKVHRTDSYQLGYHLGISYRDNCYQCHYARRNRCADLTISDYSGLGKAKPCAYNGRNVSCILVNSDKGEKFVSDLIRNNRIYADERPLCEEVENEKQLNHPTRITKIREDFIEYYVALDDFDIAIKKATKKIMIKNEIRYYLHIQEVREYLSKVLPKGIKKYLKSIIRR